MNFRLLPTLSCYFRYNCFTRPLRHFLEWGTFNALLYTHLNSTMSTKVELILFTLWLKGIWCTVFYLKTQHVVKKTLSERIRHSLKSLQSSCSFERQRPVRARDWLWRCLINQRQKNSFTIPLSPPAQHNYHRLLYPTSTWQLREKSWSVMEQSASAGCSSDLVTGRWSLSGVCVSVSVCLSGSQCFPMGMHICVLVCRRVSLSSSWSPTVAR